MKKCKFCEHIQYPDGICEVCGRNDWKKVHEDDPWITVWYVVVFIYRERVYNIMSFLTKYLKKITSELDFYNEKAIKLTN